jgi:hypothetical protein
MQLLFLFYTQAEGGAPGYLSRKGEEAAQNLTESLLQFLSSSLGINLETDFEKRAKSIDEDIQWRAFRRQESLGNAISASLRLNREVLLLLGAQDRTLKTTVALASHSALPACVDERLDESKANRKARGNLTDALKDLLLNHLSPELSPKVILVGTSLPALLEWLQSELPPDKYSECVDVLQKTSHEDTHPVVFAAGATRTSNSEVQWVFD